jgi:hypothetical protein
MSLDEGSCLSLQESGNSATVGNLLDLQRPVLLGGRINERKVISQRIKAEDRLICREYTGIRILADWNAILEHDSPGRNRQTRNGAELDPIFEELLIGHV